MVDITDSERCDEYARRLVEIRQRRGVGPAKARELMKNPSVYGAMMVNLGHADTMVAGVTQHYPETIRPALQIVRMRDDVRRVAGVYLMVFPNEIKFFADATVNIDPSAEDLADIAIQTAEVARRFNVEPRVAMLSFSNFGSAPHERSNKVREAVEILRERAPDLVADGEMQADTAVVDSLLRETYPFSRLDRAANVLIFPSLEAGNVAYKLLQRLGGAEAIGPSSPVSAVRSTSSSAARKSRRSSTWWRSRWSSPRRPLDLRISSASPDRETDRTRRARAASAGYRSTVNAVRRPRP